MRFAYKGLPSEDTEEVILGRLFAYDHPALVIDVETVSLKDTTLIGIGVSPNSREAYYFPVLPEPSPYLEWVKGLIKGAGLRIFHNAMFDLEVLGVDGRPFADTSIMAQMQGLPASLRDLAHFYLCSEIKEISDILPARHNMLDVSTETVASKCMDDCLHTFRLWEKFGGRAWDGNEGHTWTHHPNYQGGYDPLEPTSHYVSPGMKDCYQVDIRLIPLLRRMSKRGIALRPGQVRGWYEIVSKEALFYGDIVKKEGIKSIGVPVNPGSNQQVGLLLASRKNVLPLTKSRKKRQLRVDEETLEGLDDPLARVVLLYREKTKLRSTYLKPWLGEERAWTHFRLDLATRRLASFNRNLQNIPKPIRIIFAPDGETWTKIDDNQIEMRMLAYLSQDPVMMKAYREGSDIHATTQAKLWPLSGLEDEAVRTRAKVFNFMMVFYASVPALSVKTKLTKPVCATYRGEWLDLYKGVRKYMDRQMEESGRGWEESIYGRRMRLPSLDIATVEHRNKCAINYPPQGSAADVVKRQMLMLEDYDIALQVHDELLMDGDEPLPEGLDRIFPEIHTPFKRIVHPVWY